MGTSLVTMEEPSPALRRRRARFEIVFLAGIFVLFAAKMSDYLAPSLLHPSSVIGWIKSEYYQLASDIANLPFLNHCPAGHRMALVDGGFVCTSGPQDTAYDHIYSTYPLSGGGREVVYSNAEQADLTAANDLLRNQVDMTPRYPPVPLGPTPTWNEDPFKAPYWRFNYYALRPTLSLLSAYRTTRNPIYAQKALQLDESFMAAEAHSQYAWQDPHAVAFRSMSLVDTWWTLRSKRQISEASSTRMLQELEKTGQFLADPNHYQPGANHGINEATALYQLAVSFPDLPNAQAWLSAARQRLDSGIHGLVDQDGVLIENSPYYHFYVLGKYWQLYKYTLARHIPISSDFAAKIQAMVRYGTYVLQPDSQPPLLGASLATTVRDHGVYAEMAARDPSFAYVLTHGLKGTPPSHTSMYFPHAGQTIMRSGWGKGADFTSQSYLTYNVGAYRTPHSDLDALGITLYGNGETLLPDSGLYTYQPGPMRNYFHGTSAHNTVTVDNADQQKGSATAQSLVERDGLTYQAGESALYPGVDHRRVVAMLDRTHFLVVDRLNSSSVHTYQQRFHLFPGAEMRKDGLTIQGTGKSPAQSITIQQLDGSGITESDVAGQSSPPNGICSSQYQKYEPCASVSYAEQGTNAAYTTLLTVGPPDSSYSVHYDKDHATVQIDDHGRHTTLKLGDSPGQPAIVNATDPTPPAVTAADVPGGTSSGWWWPSGPGTLTSGVAADDDDRPIRTLSSGAGKTASMTNDNVHADLSNANIDLRIKVTGVPQLSSLKLELSNHQWSSSVSNNLLQVYHRQSEGEWVDISLAKGGLLNDSGGHWVTSGGPFDWSQIDAVRLSIDTHGPQAVPASVSFESLKTVPAQKQGAVVFVFDDGYESILPGAAYMRQNGLPGNVAVIGKDIELPTNGHLNTGQLQMLQNQWGWNMVNHSQNHVDAVSSYSDTGRLAAYQDDIAQGAHALQSAGLDSAPNWFIYPHGSTNAAAKSIVGKFYKFARVTSNEPIAYPFMDPLAVTDLEVHSVSDGEASQGTTITPAIVSQAVADAKQYHTTLILTFHRIHALPTDPPGYDLGDFQKVVDNVKQSGVPVLTLSQLDVSNGVPVDNHVTATTAKPGQIGVQVTGRPAHHGFWSWITNIF